MQANKLISIVIPTYNRAELLDYCLGHHISLVKSNNIKIFIFDNASPDATEIVVRKRIEEYPLIEYYKKKGLLQEVDGAQPLDTVLSSIMSALEQRR